VLTGPGSTLGDVLVTDPRVRKVSFTGSTATGTRISSIAGIKKLSLELGASCPVIILPDADLELASSAVAAGGFINAGQVCISVQRVIVDRRVEADFLDALVPKVEAIAVGNPKEADTRLGSLISEEEAIRVHTSIGEARNSGAKVLTGGDRDGAVLTPAVVAGVDPRSPLSRNELFGPAVAVSSATDIESAIAMANDNEYGLGAGIFTSDVSGSIRAMRQIDAGNIHINWTPLWRADLMPYGGLKGSGIGKEGVRSAVTEMTEEKTVILHGRPW
jgi:glyceraldehyde-3-phosphate dehydrogenase (NADP+)